MRILKSTLLFILALVILVKTGPISFHNTDSKPFIQDTSENHQSIKVPYNFSTPLNYVNYSILEKRILQFDKVNNIGKDQSGKYNVYSIELGNEKKPPILVIASMHGSEWQGAMYSMKFMEDLRDGTFPDKKFRNELLNHYHIVYIPVVNPWGYDQANINLEKSGRFNSNGEDLNRDFDQFSQVESRNVKTVMDQIKPFAFLDIHMMQSSFSSSHGNQITLGNGQSETNQIFDIFANSLSLYAGQQVTRWGANGINEGLARTYMRNQSNPYTPYTLAYIFELTRPVIRDNGLDAPLSNLQISKFGMGGLYLFLKTSIMYFEEQHISSKAA